MSLQLLRQHLTEASRISERVTPDLQTWIDYCNICRNFAKQLPISDSARLNCFRLSDAVAAYVTGNNALLPINRLNIIDGNNGVETGLLENVAKQCSVVFSVSKNLFPHGKGNTNEYFHPETGKHYNSCTVLIDENYAAMAHRLWHQIPHRSDASFAGIFIHLAYMVSKCNDHNTSTWKPAMRASENIFPEFIQVDLGNKKSETTSTKHLLIDGRNTTINKTKLQASIKGDDCSLERNKRKAKLTRNDEPNSTKSTDEEYCGLERSSNLRSKKNNEILKDNVSVTVKRNGNRYSDSEEGSDTGHVTSENNHRLKLSKYRNKFHLEKDNVNREGILGARFNKASKHTSERENGNNVLREIRTPRFHGTNTYGSSSNANNMSNPKYKCQSNGINMTTEIVQCPLEEDEINESDMVSFENLLKHLKSFLHSQLPNSDKTKQLREIICTDEIRKQTQSESSKTDLSKTRKIQARDSGQPLNADLGVGYINDDNDINDDGFSATQNSVVKFRDEKRSAKNFSKSEWRENVLIQRPQQHGELHSHENFQTNQIFETENNEPTEAERSVQTFEMQSVEMQSLGRQSIGIDSVVTQSDVHHSLGTVNQYFSQKNLNANIEKKRIQLKVFIAWNLLNIRKWLFQQSRRFTLIDFSGRDEIFTNVSGYSDAPNLTRNNVTHSKHVIQTEAQKEILNTAPSSGYTFASQSSSSRPQSTIGASEKVTTLLRFVTEGKEYSLLMNECSALLAVIEPLRALLRLVNTVSVDDLSRNWVTLLSTMSLETTETNLNELCARVTNAAALITLPEGSEEAQQLILRENDERKKIALALGEQIDAVAAEIRMILHATITEDGLKQDALRLLSLLEEQAILDGHMDIVSLLQQLQRQASMTQVENYTADTTCGRCQPNGNFTSTSNLAQNSLHNHSEARATNLGGVANLLRQSLESEQNRLRLKKLIPDVKFSVLDSDDESDDSTINSDVDNDSRSKHANANYRHIATDYRKKRKCQASRADCNKSKLVRRETDPSSVSLAVDASNYQLARQLHSFTTSSSISGNCCQDDTAQSLGATSLVTAAENDVEIIGKADTQDERHEITCAPLQAADIPAIEYHYEFKLYNAHQTVEALKRYLQKETFENDKMKKLLEETKTMLIRERKSAQECLERLQDITAENEKLKRSEKTSKQSFDVLHTSHEKTAILANQLQDLLQEKDVHVDQLSEKVKDISRQLDICKTENETLSKELNDALNEFDNIYVKHRNEVTRLHSQLRGKDVFIDELREQLVTCSSLLDSLKNEQAQLVDLNLHQFNFLLSTQMTENDAYAETVFECGASGDICATPKTCAETVDEVTTENSRPIPSIKNLEHESQCSRDASFKGVKNSDTVVDEMWTQIADAIIQSNQPSSEERQAENITPSLTNNENLPCSIKIKGATCLNCDKNFNSKVAQSNVDEATGIKEKKSKTGMLSKLSNNPHTKKRNKSAAAITSLKIIRRAARYANKVARRSFARVVQRNNPEDNEIVLKVDSLYKRKSTCSSAIPIPSDKGHIDERDSSDITLNVKKRSATECTSEQKSTHSKKKRKLLVTNIESDVVLSRENKSETASNDSSGDTGKQISLEHIYLDVLEVLAPYENDANSLNQSAVTQVLPSLSNVASNSNIIAEAASKPPEDNSALRNLVDYSTVARTDCITHEKQNSCDRMKHSEHKSQQLRLGNEERLVCDFISADQELSSHFSHLQGEMTVEDSGGIGSVNSELAKNPKDNFSRLFPNENDLDFLSKFQSDHHVSLLFQDSHAQHQSLLRLKTIVSRLKYLINFIGKADSETQSLLKEARDSHLNIYRKHCDKLKYWNIPLRLLLLGEQYEPSVLTEFFKNFKL